MSKVESFARGSDYVISEHYIAKDFDCKCSDYCNETLIDIDLVEILEKMCKYFNVRFNIKDAYQCKIQAQDSPASYHLTGEAIDIDLEGVELDGRQLYWVDIAGYAEFLGVKGIGLYVDQQNGTEWLHLDARTEPLYWENDTTNQYDGFGAYNYEDDATINNEDYINANYSSANPPPQIFQEKNPYCKNKKFCNKIQGVICHFIPIDSSQPYLGKFISAFQNSSMDSDTQQDWDELLNTLETRENTLNYNFNQPYYHAYIGKLTQPGVGPYFVTNIRPNSYVSIQTLPWHCITNGLSGCTDSFLDEGWIHVGIYSNIFSYEVKQELNSLIQYLNTLYDISPYNTVIKNDITIPQITTPYELQLLNCNSNAEIEQQELNADSIRIQLQKSGKFSKKSFYSYRLYNNINMEEVYEELYNSTTQTQASWYYDNSKQLIFTEQKLTSTSQLWRDLIEKYGASIISYMDDSYKINKVLLYGKIKYQKNDVVIFRINENDNSYNQDYPIPKYLQNSILYISKPTYEDSGIKKIDLTTYYNGPTMFTVLEHYIRKITADDFTNLNKSNQTVQLKPGALFVTGNKVPEINELKFYKIFATSDFITIGIEAHQPLGIIKTDQIKK